MNNSEKSTPPTMVEVHDLHVTLQGQPVLRNINITVPKGQTLVIIGESGCGKTVLLKSIIGLIAPTRGQVFFDGQDLAKLSDHALTAQRLRFGYLFQNAALFDSMTVGQNIAFPMRQHGGYSDEQIREIAHARLAEVGLPASIVRKKPAELSGGQRKRVGLARALAVEPELMLYDEPTTGLDPIMTDVINELIIETRRKHNVTGITVTHNMQTVQKIADRVIMLCPITRLEDDQPQVLYDGPPAGLKHAPDKRVTQFIRGEAGDRLKEMQIG